MAYSDLNPIAEPKSLNSRRAARVLLMPYGPLEPSALRGFCGLRRRVLLAQAASRGDLSDLQDLDRLAIQP